MIRPITVFGIGQIAVFAMGLFCFAIAAEPVAPRTIDMTTVLTDQKGKPIADATLVTPDDPNCSKCAPLTLGAAVATALLSERRDEPVLTPSIEKAKRAALAMRLLDNPAALLTAKETADIIRLMNIWGPIVVLRALSILDPNLDVSDK